MYDSSSTRLHGDEAALTQNGWENATANQYSAIVSRVMNHAALPEVQMLPPGNYKFHMYPKGQPRVRDLKPQQIAALLTDPKLNERAPHQRDMFAFALATGLRQGNVRLLRWQWLDLERNTAFIPAEHFKNKKPHGFALNDDALAILGRWRGQHPAFVFVYEGEPVGKVNNTAWRKLLKRHGLDGNFRWHDSRHVWASACLRAGVTGPQLMEMAGWTSAEMVKRYGHVNVDHQKELAARISGLASVAPVGTNSSQEDRIAASQRGNCLKRMGWRMGHHWPPRNPSIFEARQSMLHRSV